MKVPRTDPKIDELAGQLVGVFESHMGRDTVVLGIEDLLIDVKKLLEPLAGSDILCEVCGRKINHFYVEIISFEGRPMQFCFTHAPQKDPRDDDQEG